MLVRDTRRPLAVLLAAGLALSLASALGACSGAPEERPAPPATATPAPTAGAAPTPVATAAPTETPSPTPVATAAPTGTPSPTSTATATPTPTAEATATATPSATAFRYDTYDTTGEVATPGSYAFLADPADTTSAVTTYEALRDGTTTALLIHKSDAHGASQAALYDSVEAGDLFEWREADDCFVRHKVTEVKPDPAGTVPRKLLAVEWMTYAFTGCSGPISATTVATVDLGELPDLGGASLTAPVIHGIYQVVPAGWKGATVEALVDLDSPAEPPRDLRSYSTLAEARRLPYWRDPALPEGWILESALIPNDGPRYGYCARFRTEERTRGNNEVYRNYAFRICGLHITGWYHPDLASWHDGASVRETRVVAGRPAMVIYSPEGPDSKPDFPINIWVHDPETATDYHLVAGDGSISGSNIEAAIAIVQGLFEPPNPLPPPTTFRYDTYDTSGAVAEPGSYAFLEDPADTTTAVTTYEALRDGTTTALLIHKSDAHGASQAALYDAVEAGDLFEWHEADDCFVRYTVTEVKPDPAGAVPRKLLAVEWMTYAYTGCSGAISADAEVGMTSGNMLDLGGVGLRAPVVHGTHHLIPENWEGETEATTRHEPDTPPKQEETGASTLAEVRALHLPYWREPTLPEGWILDRAWEGGPHAPWKGFCSVYLTEPLQFPDGKERQKGIEVCGAYNTVRKFAQKASFYADQGASPDGLIVRETRVIAGRPAVILWSPPGPNYLWNADVRIYIDDPKTETSYSITVAAPHRSDLAADGNAKLEKAIALATSLFESPSALPPPTTFRYDRYDTTGEVAEPGSYAFPADPADTSSAVTTYEALRDGTTTALLIHKSDAHGASQAALYDAVEAGDLFEWHEADDCWVRYRVTEVDAGNGNVREFAIKSYSHTYTGCSGAIGSSSASGSAGAQSTERQFTWSPEVLKTGAFTTPTWHGPWLLVPENWTGPVPETEPFTPPAITWPPSPLPTFELGAGWTGGIGPGLPPWELEGIYSHIDGGTLLVYIFQLGDWPIDVYRLSDTYEAADVIHEFRMIDGRYARISYDRVRTGLSHAYVGIYDEATGLIYSVIGGPKSRNNDPEATIEIARKFILP